MTVYGAIIQDQARAIGDAVEAWRTAHDESMDVRDLEQVIGEIHRRGLVHLDLRHRSNVLAGHDGRPVVIDFASSLSFDVSTRPGRWALELFATIDRRALRKWRIRLT